MIKKIIIILALLVSSVYAKGIFSKLPYAIKLGATLPLKVENKLVYKNFKYEVTGKFGLEWDKESGVVDSIYFGYGLFDIPSILPKAWRVEGLKLCYEDRDGTSFEDVKKLLSSTGAYEIENSHDHYRKILNFVVDGNKAYEMIFFTKPEKGEHGVGLAYITITRVDGNSYDDDY